MATDATGTPTSLGIPTYNTAADSPSGLGFNAAMAVINTLIGARAMTDAVTVAGTRIIANKLSGGDAQPAFRVLGDGTLSWGPGGASAPDVVLYRTASGRLKTDGLFEVGGTLFADDNIRVDPADVGKGVVFGSSAEVLYHDATAPALRWDGNLQVGTALRLTSQGSPPFVYTGGGVLYVQGSNLKFRNLLGTVTTIV